MANRFDILQEEAKQAEAEASRSVTSRFGEELFKNLFPFAQQPTRPTTEELPGIGLEAGFLALPIGKITKAAIPNSVIKVADDALSRLISAVKEAKPVRKGIEKLASLERSRRAGAAAGILEKVEGEKGFIQAKGQLKGELVPEKPSFEPLRAEIPTITKELQPLAQEARKLESALPKEIVNLNLTDRIPSNQLVRKVGTGEIYFEDKLVKKFNTPDEAFKWLHSIENNPNYEKWLRVKKQIGEIRTGNTPELIIQRAKSFEDIPNVVDTKYSQSVFHGTSAAKIIKFDPERLGQQGAGGIGATKAELEAGFWFTSSKSEAQTIGKNVIEAKVNVKNPLIIEDADLMQTGGLGRSGAISRMEAEGFDSLIIRDKFDDVDWVFIPKDDANNIITTDFYNQAVRGVEEIGEKLSQGDIDNLFIQIQRHPDLRVFEKISAADGFSQLLQGQIPQPSKLSLLEDVFGKELIQETLSKRPALDKLKDLATEVLNIPRSLIASFDMSAPLRQGIIFTTTKPTSALKAGYEMFRQAFSEKNYANWLDDIKKDPLYRLMQDSDLYIANPRRVSGGLAAREERFMSNLAEKIPIIGQGVKAAERAYTSYLNKLRVDVFSNISTKFQNMGLNPKENAELYKSLAGFVNNATGRGDLGKLNRNAQALNTLFFSPRLIASRFNLLNPLWYAKQPPEVRKEAIKSFAEFVGVGTTILTLAKMGGADIEVDPRSTDFGKIRVGNTRWDIWGGFQQWVRVFSQMVTGARKTQKGEIIPLSRKKFPFETRFDVAERFFRGKLAPVPSLALELFEGSKMFGEELKFTQEVAENITPLYLQDIQEAFNQLGGSAMFTVGIPAFFGVGVQTYEEKKKENRFNF